MRRLFFVLLVFGIIPNAAQAHEVRPGYLELRQRDAESYEVLWKIPAVGEMRLALHPQMPESCRPKSEPIGFQTSLSCAGGLDGRRITIDGRTATLTDVLVRVAREDGSAQVVRLTPSAPSFVVAAAANRLQVAATYLELGVEHILLGIDHLLFVLALLILVRGARRLVATVTAFTGAHSLTLAAATLGFVTVPQRPVEAVIALSIVFVATEIVHGQQGRTGLTERMPWVVAFTFGLLHGFGFAGALSEVGLPPQAIPVALLFFNVGVELGQLLFIASVLGLAALGRHFAAPWPAWAWRVPPYAIGGLAAFWTIERIAGF
jgi:hydrogenase/urease accessory protein HupE